MASPTNAPTRAPLTFIDGQQFKGLLAGALASLEQNYEHVNQLNVFPVPDGDTGTNMLLTVRNAWKAIENNHSTGIGAIAVHFARGAIRGSRGNSGTILSELLRGFAGEMSSAEQADAAMLVKAFRQAVKLAYGVVQKPVEGTILTVAREIAEEIEQGAHETDDLIELLRRATLRSKQSVARTPELLPILRKAGVVDSGGQGLSYLFEGMLRAAMGEHLAPAGGQVSESAQSVGDLALTLQSADPEGYGYDVQFLVLGRNLDIAAIRAAIGNMGDSMVVTGDETAVKVHIHVHDPGVPLSYGVSQGVITDIVVENMQHQSESYIAARTAVAEPEPDVSLNAGDIAVIAVVPGDGLRRVFRSMGVASVISGGQTMNPSSGEIIDAIARLNTDRIVILPNNKNIILTAEQAIKESPGKQVQVVPTRTIPQGIAAMLAYSADGDLDSIVEQMAEAKDSVRTGEVTTATRSVELNGVAVTEGHYIGLVDGAIKVTGTDLTEVTQRLLDAMKAGQYELITVYSGADVAEGEPEALIDQLRAAYPRLEFELIEGGQPNYFYIVSVE